MNKRIYPILFMFVLTVVFVAVTAAVDVWMRPRIDLNQRLLKRRVIVEAAGLLRGRDLAPEAIDDLFNRRLREITGPATEGLETYVVTDDLGRKAGYVVRIAGQGYWGLIEGYVGVDAGVAHCTGISFLRHVETPGLGGEISKPWFKEQFAGKTLRQVTGPDESVITFKAPGEPLGPSDVHAITGATRTSDALKTFLNKDLRALMAILRK